MTETHADPEEPDNVQVDLGGWISGPCFSEEQVRSGEAARIMGELEIRISSAQPARRYWWPLRLARRAWRKR